MPIMGGLLLPWLYLWHTKTFNLIKSNSSLRIFLLVSFASCLRGLCLTQDHKDVLLSILLCVLLVVLNFYVESLVAYWLRIQHCHWCDMGSISGPGTSACHRTAKKKYWAKLPLSKCHRLSTGHCFFSTPQWSVEHKGLGVDWFGSRAVPCIYVS